MEELRRERDQVLAEARSRLRIPMMPAGHSD